MMTYAKPVLREVSIVEVISSSTTQLNSDGQLNVPVGTSQFS